MRGAYGLFAIITSNLPPHLHIPIAILIALGFLGATFQIPFNCVIGASRLSLSMSFDRILPDWMGSVNKRGAPDKFIYFHQVIASILAIVLTAYPGLFGITSAGWLAQIVAIVATLIASIVFPYSAKKLFSESPAGKYRYAGIPAITLAGIAGLIMNLWIAGYYLAEPGLGIVGASIESKIFVVGIFVACFVWFYIAREWRKRQGINIAYAFREVPPA